MPQVPIFHIDPEWYWSKERAEQEWTHIWSKLWHMGPRVEELPEPGDGFVHSLGRESLLFTHDENGEVGGLYNVCRHRGNRLLLSNDGPAFVNQFRCAFHGWCYDLDGKLRNAPYRERFDPEAINDPARTSLARFRVEKFAGWYWFTLDDLAPDLTTYLGPLGPKLAAYKMEKAQIIDYKTFEFGC